MFLGCLRVPFRAPRKRSVRADAGRRKRRPLQGAENVILHNKRLNDVFCDALGATVSGAPKNGRCVRLRDVASAVPNGVQKIKFAQKNKPNFSACFLVFGLNYFLFFGVLFADFLIKITMQTAAAIITANSAIETANHGPLVTV